MDFWSQVTNNKYSGQDRHNINSTPKNDKPVDGVSFLQSLLKVTSNIVNESNIGDPELVGIINDTIGTINKTITNLPTFNEDEIEELNKMDEALSEVNCTNINKGGCDSYLNFLDDCIEGIYDDDLDIYKIHEHIIEHLQEDKSEEIENMYETLSKYNEKLNRPITRVDRIYTEKCKEKLIGKIKQLEQNNELYKYMKSVDNILDQYNKIGPLYKIINLSSISPKTDVEQLNYRKKIIDEYIKRASKYYKLNIERRKRKGRYCSSCDTCLDDVMCSNGTIVCPKCFVTQVQIIQNAYLSDGVKVNSLSRNNYISRENFKNIMLRFCGGMNIQFPENLFDNMEKYFLSIQYMFDKTYTFEDIRLMDKNEYGQRGPFDVSDIRSALQKLGYEEHYPDAYYIGHLMWDWNKPNIDNIFKQIMDDYDVIDKIQEQIKHKYGKSSSINSYLLCYRLLRKNGFKCKVNDFKIIETDAILRKYEKMTKEIYSIAGWDPPSPIIRDVLENNSDAETGMFIMQ